ncbi:hypothetical protein NDU88_004623 [Pleurodeles waltl]|uniref:Uncharacterized protein n=1 Tax=Pleurodeles waltl TaxID=8319 RepID=A0AAV7KYB4_PLEWA|nr:hypothetical protein NDU88_004623 [Pleurodeles waltl]
MMGGQRGEKGRGGRKGKGDAGPARCLTPCCRPRCAPRSSSYWCLTRCRLVPESEGGAGPRASVPAYCSIRVCRRGRSCCPGDVPSLLQGSRYALQHLQDLTARGALSPAASAASPAPAQRGSGRVAPIDLCYTCPAVPFRFRCFQVYSLSRAGRSLGFGRTRCLTVNIRPYNGGHSVC